MNDALAIAITPVALIVGEAARQQPLFCTHKFENRAEQPGNSTARGRASVVTRGHSG